MIRVENLNKVFRVPHEKRNSLFEVVTGLGKKIEYENFYALKNINFSVKEGEFIGILGPNGSGKTTLLKLIAHILKPTSGKVKVNGSVSPLLGLGVGFRENLTAKDNIYLYGAVMGLARREINNKFGKIVRFAGLKKFIDTKLKDFSSGMQVRLAFSIAVETDSDIMLIDEVLAVGDLKFQEKCFKVFKKLKGKKTILFVSHNLNIARKFCDKVLLLDKGGQIAFGKPQEVLRLLSKK